jgi:ribose transport system permease protein
MTAIARPTLPPALRHQVWNISIWLLLVVLVGYYTTLIPSFGNFEMASIAKNSLPLVYLAIGQAIIVIAGGIDLSMGAQMVLSGAVAAQVMDEKSFVATLILAVFIILGGAVLNGFVGWIVKISAVPDIVVTLATSFIWSGLALVVLPSPGGGTSGGLRELFTGSEFGIGTNYRNSMIMMAIPMVVFAYVLRRRRVGLSIYAIGSDDNAAYLSGVDVGRAKVWSYAFGGAMAAMAGLATLAITGIGDPRASIGAKATLNSVAAIVLGGIALTGGTGSVIGVVAAAIILFFLNPILSAKGIDPNTAQVMQGSLIVIVMMIAGYSHHRSERAS